jgi:hypothetical protein
MAFGSRVDVGGAERSAVDARATRLDVCRRCKAGTASTVRPTPIDWLALTLDGARVQDANWRQVVQKVGATASVAQRVGRTNARGT